MYALKRVTHSALYSLGIPELRVKKNTPNSTPGISFSIYPRLKNPGMTKAHEQREILRTDALKEWEERKYAWDNPSEEFIKWQSALVYSTLEKIDDRKIQNYSTKGGYEFANQCLLSFMSNMTFVIEEAVQGKSFDSLIDRLISGSEKKEEEKAFFYKVLSGIASLNRDHPDSHVYKQSLQGIYNICLQSTTEERRRCAADLMRDLFFALEKLLDSSTFASFRRHAYLAQASDGQ